MTTFTLPLSVSIERARWSVKIRVVDADGKEHEFIASADGCMTQGSSIWFGTHEEYLEDYR